jgi:hypothetical protein
MQQTWSLEEIRHKIATNDTWLCRGIIAIYKRQTADEQRNRTTSEPNGFGYNLKDSFIMSTLAEHLLKGFTLSEEQRHIARMRLSKYARQLTKIANQSG